MVSAFAGAGMSEQLVFLSAPETMGENTSGTVAAEYCGVGGEPFPWQREFNVCVAGGASCNRAWVFCLSDPGVV